MNDSYLKPESLPLKNHPRLNELWIQNLTERIEEAGLDMLGYNTWDKDYRLRLTKDDIQSKSETLKKLSRLAYDQKAKV